MQEFLRIRHFGIARKENIYKKGEVTKDGDNYVCPITIATEAYAEAYSVENGKHTAIKPTITYNMTWDGEKWQAPTYSKLPTIDVACSRCFFPFGW